MAPAGDRRRVRVGDPAGDPLPGAGRGGQRHVRSDLDDLDGDDDGARRARSWPQRLILGVGVTLVLFCMLGASVAGYALVQYGNISRVDNLQLHQAAEGEPENYLIVAPDTREGHSGVNTDTIMVVRVDPSSDRLALTSFPRDLMVTVADTGETGMINAVYNRTDGTGPQNLIHTLQQNYGITIHHFIEVNFESFKQVVDSVGGVSVWMEVAARDKGSGFYSEDLGCVSLDGERGLEFVRSRKLEIMQDGEWVHDPLSDVNRVQRQQIFIQRAMSKALADVKSNPLRVQQLVSIAVENVTLDPNLGIGDLKDLGEHFQGFDPANFETYPLPTLPWPQNENRLVLDDAGAEPMLNVFRGLPPGEIGPGLVDVNVLNGTSADPAQERQNLASDVSSALQQVGFDVGTPGDAETFYAQTTIQHAPGQETYAQRVARHLTSPTAIPTEVNTELSPGQVVVIAGADFTTVHDQATPIEAMPVPPGQEPVATTVPNEEATTPTTVAEAPAPPPPTTNPFIVGAVPENADC
ncbi:MAG TPA: LCP family protein [Acidimicrobiales bacterium]|nr:LCP family protein [Acidimicrobiales bacterium]